MDLSDPVPSQGPIDNSFEQQRRGLLSRFRREGSIAVQGAEELTEADSISAAEQFGVAKELSEYVDSWLTYTGIIDDFVADDSNYELFESVKSHMSVRHTRGNGYKKQREALANQAFTGLVRVHVLEGRIERTFKREVRGGLVDSGASLGAVALGAVAAGRDKLEIKSKRNGLFSNFHNKPVAEELDRRFADLSDRISRTYGPILKIEDRILEKLYKAVDGNPGRAKQLIESFLEAQDSEAALDKAFVRFLATGHAVDPEDSVLAAALETVKQGAEAGSVAEEFVQESLTENEGDNQLQFFADLLKNSGITDFTGLISGRFEDWPSDMKAKYDAFRGKFLSSLATGIHRTTAKATQKMWLWPTVDMYEAEVDRVFNTLHGAYARGTKKSKGSSSKKISSSVLRTDDVMPDEFAEKTTPPRVPAIVVQGLNEVVWYEDSTIAEVVDALIPKGRARDRRFREDVERIVQKLTEDPFGTGTQLLRGLRGRTKFYRVNPVHAEIPVRDAKNARVIFTVKNGHVGIYSITADHQDYEQAVDNIKKSKL